MTPQQAEAYIRRRALEVGVNPDIAASVWKQESGGSTDLGLRGQTIERGKWKGHYARGPWQIMSFHGPIPDTFEGQTDWALEHLKERGVRGYYGEGTPGVAGHPSTDQYEQQVLARAGIDPRMAGDMAGAPAISPHTLPDRMTMNSNPGASLLHEQALNQVMGLLADKPERPMHWADVAGALGSGLLNARPGQNAWGSALGSLNQSLQAHRQAQMEQPRTDAYRAQTLLATLNQFGARGLTPDERYRAIRNEVWMSPDGTRAAVFRYDPSLNNGEGGYLEGPPPAGWSNIDKGMPPGMQRGGGGAETLPPTLTMQEAQFAYPDDPEAQQEAVRRAKFDGGGKGSGGKQSSLEQYQSLAQNVLTGMEKYLFDEETGIFAEANRSGQRIGDWAGDATTNLAGPLNVIPRAVRTGWNYLGQSGEVAENTKAYLDTAKGRMSPLVKALGDSGNVGKGEADNLLNSLPNPWTDTPETAKKKWGELTGLINDAVRRASQDPEWVKKHAYLLGGNQGTPGDFSESPPQEKANPYLNMTPEQLDAEEQRILRGQP